MTAFPDAARPADAAGGAALVDALVAAFPEAAMHRSDVRVVRAPGRVNLIGASERLASTGD